jgi:hypothetical protein
VGPVPEDGISLLMGQSVPARKLLVESSQAVRRSHLEELILGSIGTRQMRTFTPIVAMYKHSVQAIIQEAISDC